MKKFTFYNSKSNCMRKTKYWFGLLTLCVMLISAQQINAQLYNVAGTCTMSVASNVYGPMYSTTNSDAASRTAVIYPASQLTGIAGQELTSIYFNRIGATTDPAGGTPNFKVYLKETSDVDFGTAALDWATVVTGATLVYDSDPLTAMQGGLGWKQFTFNEDNFTYSGTNNLILLMEYVNTGNTTNVQWQYEYISPCVDTSNSMTTKYVNTTDGTQGASLSSQNYRRPQIAFDFTVDCPAPTNIIISDITTTGITIDWTAGGTETTWDYVIQSQGSGIPTVFSQATSTTLIVSDLDSETSYEFYVRQDCGTVDGVSLWAGPYSFFTGYCEVTSTSTTNGIGNFTTTGGIMNINNSSTGGSYSNYTTQSVAQFEGGADVQFTITAANGTTGMGVWIDWNNDLDFDDPGEHIYNSAAYTATGSGTITIPSGTPVGNYRMRVVANWLSTNPTPCGDLGSIAYGEAEDYTFTVIDPPTCMPPTALTALNVTADSAVLSWTSDGTLFDIKWGVPGFDVETGGTLIVGVTNPYALSGLTQSTSYQYYVRQDCGVDDGLSLWAGPFTFTTTQVPVVLDYEEDFEGAHNWILSNGTQTNKWVVGEATNNGGTHAMYISNDNGVTNGYSITSASTVHAYRDIQIPTDADA